MDKSKKIDIYGKFYVFQFILGIFSLICTGLVIADFYINRKINNLTIAFAAICSLAAIFFILIIKYRILYRNTLKSLTKQSHSIVHKTRNFYLNMNQIFSENFSNYDIDKACGSVEELSQLCIKDCLNDLCQTLHVISGNEVYSMIKLFQVEKKQIIHNISDIVPDNITVGVFSQSSNTPPFLKREFNLSKHILRINTEVDYYSMLQNKLKWLYIPDMQKYLDEIQEPQKHISKPLKQDDDFVKFTGSKIIVPISYERTGIGYVNLNSSNFETSCDLIGFLVVYAKERNAFIPEDELIYSNLCAGSADSFYKIFKRLRSYRNKYDDFYFCSEKCEKKLLHDKEFIF